MFNKEKVLSIHEEIQKAMEDIEKKHNVTIDFGNINWNEHEYKTKMTVEPNEAIQVKEDNKSAYFATEMIRRGKFELKDLFGRKIDVQGKILEVCDYKPRATKRFIVVKDEENVEYTITEDTLLKTLI